MIMMIQGKRRIGIAVRDCLICPRVLVNTLDLIYGKWIGLRKILSYRSSGCRSSWNGLKLMRRMEGDTIILTSRYLKV